MKINQLLAQLLLVFLFMSATLRTIAQEYSSVIGDYEYVFSDREGRPSKCDCDYYLQQIALNPDGSFEIMEQRGRLSPKQHFEKGVWKLEQDSIVVMHITSENGSLYVGVTESEREWTTSTRQEHFIFHQFRLHSFGRDREYFKFSK